MEGPKTSGRGGKSGRSGGTTRKHGSSNKPSYGRGAGGGKGGAGAGSKNATAELLSAFRYDAPGIHGHVQGGSSTHSQYRNNNKGQGRGSKSYYRPSLSRYQYLAANHRFVLSPLTPAADECWLHSDAPLPWTHVVRVEVRASECQNNHTEANEAIANDEPTNDAHGCCPICLSPPELPHITRCGHVYCLTCALRFLAYAGTCTSLLYTLLYASLLLSVFPFS